MKILENSLKLFKRNLKAPRFHKIKCTFNARKCDTDSFKIVYRENNSF